MRQEALEVPPQDIITRDNVTLKVNAVIFLRVIDPNKAVVAVSNYMYQTSQFAQTTLRSVLGEVDLDELLAHREKINLRLQSILDQHTDPWGVKVTNVEVKQVDLPETMTRAMAKQAEAEREKRSKIIHAEGEFAAAQRLIDAAHLLASEPVSIQLRYLQTLTEIGVEKNTTIIFPVPVDLLAGLQNLVKLDAARIASLAAALRKSNWKAPSERGLAVHSMASDDTEITLGVGKLLGLVFPAGGDLRHFLFHRLFAGQELRPRAGAERSACADHSLRRHRPSASSNPKPSAAVTTKPESQAPASDEASTRRPARQPHLL